MYKNRVENNNFVWKFLLFYLANEEIQQKTERENSKISCYYEFSYSRFPRSQNKRVGIYKKKNVVLYPIFIHYLTIYLHAHLQIENFLSTVILWPAKINYNLHFCSFYSCRTV